MSDGGTRPDSRLVFDVDDLPEPAFSVTLNRRIVTWNAAAARYFSLRTADVVGRYCFEVVMQRPGMRGTPCAFCAMARANRKRNAALSGTSILGASPARADATPEIGFRTFTARTTTGEIQLVHLLAVPQQPRVAVVEPAAPAAEADQVECDLPPVLLTAREREVLRLLADGLTTAEIAARLSISRITARNHVTHVMDKLEVKSRLRAVIVAAQRGLL